MLAKVLKYDLKYIYKVLIVFYILSLLFAGLTRILFCFSSSLILNILAQISSGVTISMIFNIIINNIMRTWTRFIKNIYGDESYLTHTLPISKRVIYISKFFSGVITMLTSIVVIIITITIAYYSKENLNIIKESLNMIAYTYDSSIIKLLLTIFIILFLQMTYIIQAGYTGIILGHKKNNHKIVKSIIYGMIIYMAFQIFTLFVIFITALFNKDIMNLFITNGPIDINIAKKILMLGIFIYFLYLYILYFIDVKLIRKGVNVE